MDMNNLPESFKIAEETADAIWVYPILEDGTYSKQKVKLFEKGDQEDTTTFARVAWANASTYIKAARIINEQTIEDINLTLPSAVLSAFSCEVYLKSMIDPNSIKGDKHNLKNLFNHLSADIKNKIYKRLASSNIITEFEETLANNADIFKKLRYIHEKNSYQYNLNFLMWFADTLNQVSKDVLAI
jgi:hypothetical protein